MNSNISSKSFENNSNRVVSRRKFLVDISVVLAGLMGGPLNIEALAGPQKVPSAVREEDYRIRQAYLYIWNIERSTGVSLDNREHAGKILGIFKTIKGDPNMVVPKGSPLSFMSPIYAALIRKRGAPFSEEELQSAATNGNVTFPNLVRGMYQLLPLRGNPKLAREYFLKTMLEVANLQSKDFERISEHVGKNINAGNFVSEFGSLQKEQKAWIFDNVFDKKVMSKPVPKNQYHYHPGREELKQPGLDLKNFYFSLGFLAIAEDLIYNDGPESVGRTYKDESSLYQRLAKKFGYHTAYKPIVFGP